MKFNPKYILPSKQYIKSISSNITGDIKNTGKYYKGNFLYGWESASRLSRIKKYNSSKSFIYKIIGAISKTKVKNEHIPTILGGVGAISPLPGGTILGYGIGKVISKLIKSFK